MVFRAAIIVSALLFTAVKAVPAVAQERVTVATTRSVANGALFLAAARGYFKAEGITVDMTAHPSDAGVVKAMLSGTADVALTLWSIETVKGAASGSFKAIAAQAHERNGFEGNEVVVSAAAYDRGITRLDQLFNGVVMMDQVGSNLHYQFDQARQLKGAKGATYTVRFAGSALGAATAIREGRADVAVLPMIEARNLLSTNQAKLLTWSSQFADTELGALFASAKMLGERRAATEKFLRAYRKGAADYAAAFLRLDRYSKRVSNLQSHDAAKIIAFYVYPSAALDDATATAEGEVHFMNAQAKIDTADLERRIAWYQAEGMLDKAVTAQNIVDLNFK